MLSSIKTIFTNAGNAFGILALVLFVSACGGGGEGDGKEPPVLQHTLTVIISGSGTVASSPSGINCGSDCSEAFAENSSVSLTATPAQNFEFVGWEGGCSGAGVCNILMSTSATATAVFQETNTVTHLLSVSIVGGGSVSSSPSGINCGSDCSQNYAENTSVSLVASAATGFEFSAWGGSCSGTGTCEVNMSVARTVSATFSAVVINQFTLSTTSSSGGKIISSPAGIDCGSDCSQLFQENTTVALTAVADSGFELSAWGGDCNGANQCNFSMDANKTVTATFTEISGNQFTLNASVNSGGSIVSSPAGIDCGIDCTQNYQENISVALTAVPETGFELSAWGGSCNGVNTCNVLMDSNKSVSASFQEIDTGANEFTLSVSVNAGGTVTSSPSGINCGSDCSEIYLKDTAVSLTATPQSGYLLESWSGNCSGNVQCNLTMTEDKAVTANFVADGGQGGDLSIADMGMHEVAHGTIFVYQPVITGEATICRKDIGHDDVKVDSETGRITWDTAGLNFGRGFHIRIKCSNYTESVYASMVVHVDKSGSSRLRVAGQNGVSQYIGVAGRAMSSGDTIVYPDGEYPVSVAADESFENAFKSTAPTSGSVNQYSTIMSESPGGVVINGAARGNIGKQKNAFQLSSASYVAIVGFVVKNVQRESLTSISPLTNVIIDFVGAQGAGTWGLPCSNFSEAGQGGCSNAGMRVNGGNPLFQSSYDWGHNRYGIMTRSTDGSITRRSFVRLDEHRGDQPYGGFSNYCDIKHLSQDNTVFDSLAIAAPHYKNYAGLEAYPATGCESQSATLKTVGLLAVNNKLSLSLMDAQVGPNHIWDSIVSYDSEGTCTPQGDRCASWLLQADKTTDVTNSYFGKARGFGGSSSIRTAFDLADVNLTASVTIEDVPGQASTGTPPAYLPQSQLYYRGRSDTFHGDTGYDGLTTTRRWPIAGEDIIATNMRSYSNPTAIAVGGGTVNIDGNRGAVATNESMSEYFWGYTDAKIPPLVVRVKDKGSINRVAWEHLSVSRRNSVTGWKVVCMSTGGNVLATLASSQLVYEDSSSCQQYAVKASYADGDSGIAYTESAE